MVGTKLLWTGLTIIVATAWLVVPAKEIVGSVLMIIGLILMWMDK
jgi:hypothetical protein